MKKILLTTTETLHGWEIETYLKPVFANVVVGAGFLSDFNASITDFFGGRSDSYEKKLQGVNDNALNILKSKALELGANCILGLRVDMAQISGKNVQMFMVTAYGTAVVAKAQSAPKVVSSLEVDKSTINDKAILIKLLNEIQNSDYRWTAQDLQLMIDSKSGDFKDHVFKKLKDHITLNSIDTEAVIKTTKLFSEYFASIDPEEAISTLYDGLVGETEIRVLKTISDILGRYDLVDYNYCGKLLESDSLHKKKIVLKILKSDKPFYIATDIGSINELIVKIESSFPTIAVISTKKGFLSSNEKEMWTCECGKANAFDLTYCNNCTKDKFGFQYNELQPNDTIISLRNKSLALSDFFKS